MTVGLTVLVVDDSAVMRALVKRAVTVVDAAVTIDTVLEAANGREALAQLESHTVDVVLTDINMPVMTGIELIREIRTRPAWPELVCVVMSSDASAARRREVKSLGVELFIGKPFRPEVMRDVLNRVPDRAGAR